MDEDEVRYNIQRARAIMVANSFHAAQDCVAAILMSQR